MPVSRTSTRALLPLLGTGLLMAGAVAVPAFADTGTGSSIAFANVTYGQVLSGVAEIDVAIQQDPSAPVSSLTLRVPMLSASTLAEQNVPRTIAVPASCTDSCTLAFTVDTTKTTTFAGSSTAVPLLPDQGIDIEVSSLLATAAGGTAQGPIATTEVVVDNRRPSTTLLNVPETGPVGIGADQRLTVQAEAAPAADAPAGTTVTSLHLVVPGRPGWPAISFTPAVDGRWTATADTSAIPTGLYDADAVATDSNGVPGNPTPVKLVVDHGFNVSLADGNVLSPNALADTAIHIDYGDNAGTGCGMGGAGLFAAPQQVDLYVDGKHFAHGGLNPNGASCDWPLGGAETAAPALPFGHHKLRIVVTDDRGATGEANEAVTVALPLKLTFSPAPTKGKLIVGVGSRTILKATEYAPDGFSKGTSWRVFQSGTDGNSSFGRKGSTPDTVPFDADRTGRDVFEYYVQSDNGLVTDQYLDVLVVTSTSSSLKLSASKAKHNRTVTFTAHTTECTSLSTAKRPNLKGATVELQFQAKGSKTWSTKATATTNASGSATFHEKATANGKWRTLTLAKNAVWTGSTSATHTLTVTK